MVATSHMWLFKFKLITINKIKKSTSPSGTNHISSARELLCLVATAGEGAD